MDNKGRGVDIRTVSIFVLGIIVGIVLTFLWFRTVTKDSGLVGKVSGTDSEQSKDDGVTVNANFDNLLTDTISQSESIKVVDQDAGEFVAINSLNFPASVWIAVYEESNGKPSRILGARLFSPKVRSGNVELLRNTDPNKSYYAVAHYDNGDKQFDYKVDTKMKDSSGNDILAKFKTISSD